MLPPKPGHPIWHLLQTLCKPTTKLEQKQPTPTGLTTSHKSSPTPTTLHLPLTPLTHHHHSKHHHILKATVPYIFSSASCTDIFSSASCTDKAAAQFLDLNHVSSSSVFFNRPTDHPQTIWLKTISKSYPCWIALLAELFLSSSSLPSFEVI